MKVLKVVEPGKFEFEERPIPEPGEGEILLKMNYCGICGSDVRVFTGNHPYASYPRVMGHEISAQVGGLSATVNPYFTCETCDACKNGKSNCCLNNQTMGVQRDGAYAEYVVVPNKKITYIDTRFSVAVDTQILALTEPFSVAHHAIDRGDIQKGDRVIIFGAGPIGIFCGLCALEKGAKVCMLDPHPKKIEIAVDLGLDAPLDRKYYDVCVDASGSKQAISDCFEIARPGGKVILVGHSKEDIPMPHSDIIKKELSIFASRNAPQLVTNQLILIRSNVQKIITHIVPFEEVPEFFKKLAAHDGTVLKALIKF
jgi:2-desacetyl-2-hydroxyethyl bacteriochlorophyllide A dehydrogenase